MQRRRRRSGGGQAAAPATMEGYLTKQGGSGSGRGFVARLVRTKNWKKRWFELRGKTLTYYAARGGAVKGSVELAGARLHVGPKSFAVEKPDGSRMGLMCCEGTGKHAAWVQALQFAIGGGETAPPPEQQAMLMQLMRDHPTDTPDQISARFAELMSSGPPASGAVGGGAPDPSAAAIASSASSVSHRGVSALRAKINRSSLDYDQKATLRGLAEAVRPRREPQSLVDVVGRLIDGEGDAARAALADGGSSAAACFVEGALLWAEVNWWENSDDEGSDEDEDDLGENAAAIKKLREAVRLDPSLSDAWFLLGLALDEASSVYGEEGIAVMETCIALDPEHSAAHGWLGKFLQWGDRDDEVGAERQRATAPKQSPVARSEPRSRGTAAETAGSDAPRRPPSSPGSSKATNGERGSRGSRRGLARAATKSDRSTRRGSSGKVRRRSGRSGRGSHPVVAAGVRRDPAGTDWQSRPTTPTATRTSTWPRSCLTAATWREQRHRCERRPPTLTAAWRPAANWAYCC